MIPYVGVRECANCGNAIAQKPQYAGPNGAWWHFSPEEATTKECPRRDGTPTATPKVP